MPWTKIVEENQEVINDLTEGDGTRKISYSTALREALDQALTKDQRLFIMGQGVDDASGMFGATKDLHKKHGKERIFDTPLSENALTGIAIGAALAGLRPFYCHNRPDFLLLTMDQIVNHASKWRYMFGGNSKVPIVIWAVTGRGWGSGPQHSQALQGLFMHIPGLKIVMPSTPYDVKGLIITSIADDNPVIFLEHRRVFNQIGYVPEELYSIPFGKGVIRKEGKDITIVAISQMVLEAMRAANQLGKNGIDAEVIDLRTIKPFDEEIIINSIKKTGRLIIADTGWQTGGVSSEIAATIGEKGFYYLKKPIARVACPDVPTPASNVLEDAFYPNSTDIINKAIELMIF